LTPDALIEVQDDIQSIMSTPTRRKKVLLADDHHLILDALTTMMGGDFEVMAVDNSDAFIQAVATFEPDLAILDINMPGGNGIMTAKRTLELRPNLPIVFLSMYADPQYVDQAIQVGARAYLSKVAPAQELISAIHAVLEGETLITAPAKDEVLSTPPSGKSDLTMRQREVLRLIAMGSSAKDIANQLNISVRTAEFHRAAIMQRLGLHSTAQMTRYAIANNIA
jgi:DNA-binding NarL/FixJ family response regulator